MSDSAINRLFRELEETISKKTSRVPKSFSLLFRARSPADLENFHTSCDAKGPTLTILHGKYNVLYGGYTSKNWLSAKKQSVEDTTAFLFYKNINDQEKCNIFPVTSSSADRAITHDANFGPTFGGGLLHEYDLQTFVLNTKNKSEMKENFLHLNGKHTFNSAYKCDKVTLKKNAINGGTMDVKMMEVYQVTDDILHEPWRERPEKEKLDEMKTYLETFEPLSSLEIPCYNILLVGVIGSGKSSFYNTLATVFAGEVKETAPTAEESTSITNEVHEYHVISHESEKPLNLKIFDIRGFDAERNYEQELEHLLKGRLPTNYVFPEKPVKLRPEQLLSDPKLRHEMHLVCFVVDASKLGMQKENHQLANAYKSVKDIIRRKGLPIVAVATKFDQLCPRIRSSADATYTSPKAKSSVAAIAGFLGLKEKHVYPIVNYINDTRNSNGKDILAVQALYSMVKLTDDYMQHRAIAKKKDTWAKGLTYLEENGGYDRALMNVQIELSKLAKQEQEIRVLCVGALNSGKSSFIDSIYSAVVGKIKSNAIGGVTRDTNNANAQSATERFQLYPLKYKGQDGYDHPAHVTFGDMPGFQAEGGIELKHVKMVIKGIVPNRYKIIKGFSGESVESKTRKKDKKGRFHCVCLVFDITTLDSLPKSATDACSSLIKWLYDKGIPYIVVLTKSDKLSKAVDGCTLDLFENDSVKEKKSKLMKMFNFKESKIFPVRNYIHEGQVVRDRDVLLLTAFKEILELGKEYLEEGSETLSSDDDNDISNVD